ncbi:hypothetical protein QTO34_005553 [Cnephaeus nilssonii]|uniref:Palmitoyltransferase n=2 Tax=Boreoeutheria TaxID=1437010 RepID=A0AA40LI86_CNENI|nr:hypothetical protein QTO34_005553 [Eptesicus nilssonii]
MNYLFPPVYPGSPVSGRGCSRAAEEQQEQKEFTPLLTRLPPRDPSGSWVPGAGADRHPAPPSPPTFDGLQRDVSSPLLFRSTGMAQTLSSRRHWRRELSILLAQSATPATPSPAPCAFLWSNRGRSEVMDCKMGLRIHFVVDPHGWCCMGLIVFVWLYNIVIIPKIVLFPHYEEGHIPGILIIIFYGIAIFCLVALVRASVTDPGRLPENPKIPHGEREFWELCNKCNLMRPKRSHHCSRCGHCVRRMDHHCPWINNCVGEDNHWLFLQLCFYTELLTCYALMFSFCHYYYFLPLKKRNLGRSGQQPPLAPLMALVLLIPAAGASSIHSAPSGCE